MYCFTTPPIFAFCPFFSVSCRILGLQPAVDMAYLVDDYVNKLEHLSSDASAILVRRNSLIDRASHQGLLEAVTKRLFDRKSKDSYPTPPNSNRSVSRRSPSSIASVSLASAGRFGRTLRLLTYRTR